MSTLWETSQYVGWCDCGLGNVHAVGCCGRELVAVGRAIDVGCGVGIEGSREDKIALSRSDEAFKDQ